MVSGRCPGQKTRPARAQKSTSAAGAAAADRLFDKAVVRVLSHPSLPHIIIQDELNKHPEPDVCAWGKGDDVRVNQGIANV